MKKITDISDCHWHCKRHGDRQRTHAHQNHIAKVGVSAVRYELVSWPRTNTPSKSLHRKQSRHPP
ncbi:MAG: hypothetical protein ACODAD_14280, partial [Planctomycetota bacterium]